jgi:tetratricopeptide (TPR) repeat protein
MSDPTTPTGAGAKAAPRAGKPVEHRKKASMFDDPMVRIMAWVAAGLSALYLAAIVGALFTGVLASPTPRTASERALDAAQSVVKGGDHSAKALADYVNALIDLQQYGQAQTVIDTAPKTAFGTITGDLEVAQARLYLAEKDYAKVPAAADAATKLIQTQYDAQLKKSGVNNSKALGIDSNYYDAVLIKALAAQAAGDPRGAIASFDIYLKKNPMESDVLVDRAQAKLQLKDTAGAKADFQEALKFVPDNQLALDGLKTIGARP